VATGLYLYCIGHKDTLSDERVQLLDAHPPDGSESLFRTVVYGDLAALVSETETFQFEIDRDQLMAHHHVLEEAMKLGDILPVSYGTVATSEDDIVETLLAGASDQLKANLEHISGRVELSVRVMWNQETLFQEIVEDYEDIRRLRDTIAGVPEEQSYSERIQLGELTNHAIISKSEAERDSILQRLGSTAVDVHLSPNTSEMLLLNASFLVDKDREAEFDEAVQEIGRATQDRMTIRYLGPLPPASFAGVTVESDR
jgi:hypothetical protein